MIADTVRVTNVCIIIIKGLLYQQTTDQKHLRSTVLCMSSTTAVADTNPSCIVASSAALRAS